VDYDNNPVTMDTLLLLHYLHDGLQNAPMNVKNSINQSYYPHIFLQYYDIKGIKTASTKHSYLWVDNLL